MKNIHPGDKIFGRDGNVYNVVGESVVWKLPAWKLNFNDGSEIISNDAHEWLTFDRKDQMALHKRTDKFRDKNKIYKNPSRKNMHAKRDMEKFKLPLPQGSIKSTKEIVESIKTRDGRNNHAIPLAEAINLPEKDLPIHPYLLGVWLGDGTARDGAITSMDFPIIDRIVNLGYKLISVAKNKGKSSLYRFKNLRTLLRKENLFCNKHIPENYLFASKMQRLELLRGLMDTDGCVSKNGNIDFVNTNKQIIDGIHKLITSLGWKCSIREGRAKLYGVDKGFKWTVSFAPKNNEIVFHLPRKIARQQNAKRRLNNFRYIVQRKK